MTHISRYYPLTIVRHKLFFYVCNIWWIIKREKKYYIYIYIPIITYNIFNPSRKEKKWTIRPSSVTNKSKTCYLYFVHRWWQFFFLYCCAVLSLRKKIYHLPWQVNPVMIRNTYIHDNSYYRDSNYHKHTVRIR